MFAVFAGDRYYPYGGWRDYAGTFETLDAARASIPQGPPDPYHDVWAHIVDLRTAEIVYESRR